jgi:hypothetical protein
MKNFTDFQQTNNWARYLFMKIYGKQIFVDTTFYFVHRLIFYEAPRFGSRLCLRLQVRKTPTLADSLDISILSYWALSNGSARVSTFISLKKEAERASET